jgi:predicted MFS family arabinose efflux permease
VLDIGRAAQGVGAAAMFAASLALLANEFQGAQRGFALGVWGAITGAALAIGPLVGGLLVDGLGWRVIFLVNLPIGVALTVLTLRRLPESRDRSPRGLDLPGLVTFGAACFLGTYGLIRGNEDGWTSAPVLGSLVAATLLLAAFVAIERRAAAPMLAPALFRIPAFTGTAIVAFAQSVALYPLFLFLAVYLQTGLGYSATETGLRLLPLTLVLFAVAPISGRLTSRVALRLPLVTGLVLIALGLLLMRGLTETSDWTHLLPGFIVGGLAIGVISPASASSASPSGSPCSARYSHTTRTAASPDSSMDSTPSSSWPPPSPPRVRPSPGRCSPTSVFSRARRPILRARPAARSSTPRGRGARSPRFPHRAAS